MRFAALLLVCISLTTTGQTRKGFFELSGPKRTWVIFHPFKAEKAFQISKEANKTSDSIAKTSLLDGDKSGGQVDAFRHAYWMARLHQEIGKSAAKSLGIAHEKENYLTFKKAGLEDGILPDKPSSDMDLWNNQVGLDLISHGSRVSRIGLIYRVVNAIHQGKMRVIKKNRQGYFLTCTDQRIDPKSLLGKWNNDKCLIPSNEN